MKINLPLRTFSFFKVVVSFFILTTALVFPLAGFVSLMILVVGRAHTLGAWLAMWRSKKLTWYYLFSIVLVTSVLSFWGFTTASITALSFSAYSFFAFHFLFDEYDLQEEKRKGGNIFSSISPAISVILILISNYLHIGMTTTFFATIIGIFFIMEMFLITEINWFFVNAKILTIFILIAHTLGFSAPTILNMFLVSHYLFWFIYPVYNLHRYKREERDGFIMILIIVMLLSVFIYSSKVWGGTENIDVSLRSFYIASLVHVLLTAPFGYLFGLPKPSKY